ncbi:hypothetical protein HDU76_011264 [Blyttiomyces sp. JEL0837]|nr:hypothetical protein HDU76_011264 [Blyttiomyces sp. JEL0837]
MQQQPQYAQQTTYYQAQQPYYNKSNGAMDSKQKGAIIGLVTMSVITAIIGSFATNSYAWLTASYSRYSLSVGFFSAQECNDGNCDYYTVDCKGNQGDANAFCGQYNAGRGLLAAADLLGFLAVICAACIFKWRQSKALHYAVIGSLFIAAVLYFVTIFLAGQLKDKLSNLVDYKFDYGYARIVDIMAGIFAIITAGLAGYALSVVPEY